MNIDNINNSQMILLVFLVTFVTSAATAIATLSLVYEQIQQPDTAVQQPTIVERTINRIIERERPHQPVPLVVGVEPVPVPPEEDSFTLSDVRSASVFIRFGSQDITTGMTVSPDGALIAADRLQEERRYSVETGNGALAFFSVVYSSDHYSLLMPVEPYIPAAYIPPGALSGASLCESVLVFGDTGDQVRLFSEIVSQVDTGVGRVRTSVTASDAVLPSAVFTNDEFVGFVTDESGWVPIIPFDMLNAILSGAVVPPIDTVSGSDALTDIEAEDTSVDDGGQSEAALETGEEEGDGLL